MFEWITSTIRGLGYTGVALLTFLENVFPPIPSELVIPLAGCAGGKGRIHISKLCKGAGGTWNAQAETCDGAAANVRQAAQMCQAHGGVYEKSTGNCEGIGLD